MSSKYREDKQLLEGSYIGTRIPKRLSKVRIGDRFNIKGKVYILAEMKYGKYKSNNTETMACVNMIEILTGELMCDGKFPVSNKWDISKTEQAWIGCILEHRVLSAESEIDKETIRILGL